MRSEKSSQCAPALPTLDTFSPGGQPRALLRATGPWGLLQGFPSECHRVEGLATEDATFEQAERQIFGTTHADIGAYVCRHWGLPAPIGQAALHHGTPTVLLGISFVEHLMSIHQGLAAGTLTVPLPRAGVEGWPVIGPKDYAAWSAASDNLQAIAAQNQEHLRMWAETFEEPIRAAGARPALYMVWPAESRSQDFPGVFAAYSNAAEAVDGIFLPAGQAWRAAWERDASPPLYGGDGFHPSLLGSWLAALVIYSALYDAPAAEVPATLVIGGSNVSIPEASAAILREAATATLEAFR